MDTGIRPTQESERCIISGSILPLCNVKGVEALLCVGWDGPLKYNAFKTFHNYAGQSHWPDKRQVPTDIGIWLQDIQLRVSKQKAPQTLLVTMGTTV